MITKEINIFNPAKRNVKCIANQLREYAPIEYFSGRLSFIE